MNSFKALLKVNFTGLLYLFKGTGSKKSKMSTNAVLLLMIGLSLYISVVYSFLLGSIFGPAGLLDLMMAMMAVVICLFSLMFTAFGASGIVFGGKDMDLMLSLPLSAFHVMLSKVMALYLENLMLCGLMMLPCAAAYIRYGGKWNVYFLIAVVVLTLFLAVIPTILALIVGYCLALLQGRFGSNALLNNLSYFVFFVVVMFFSMQINVIMQKSLLNTTSIKAAFSTWLLPVWFYIEGILGKPLSALAFIAITAIPFLLIVFLFSRKYKVILSKLTTKTARSDYKMGSLRASGQFSSLLKKEMGRYWGTPIYLFNTGTGIILAIGGSVYACIRQDMVQALFVQMGGGKLPLLFLMAAFICVTIDPAAVSISLEGKTLWILKEAPVSAKTILLAKGVMNAVLILATGIICIPLLAFGMRLNGVEIFCLLFLCIAFSVFVPSAGLWVNLLFPKMDASNDMLVVKQSMSAIVCLLGGMGVIGVSSIVYMVLAAFLPSVLVLFGASLLVLTVGVILMLLLAKHGEERLLKL